MGYYIRILGITDPDISLDELNDSLKSKGLSAKLSLPEGELPNKWSILEVENDKGDPLAQIERNPVIEGELGHDELMELKEEIQEYKPDSASKWLTKYFDKIRVIYAFQMLNASFEDNNYQIVDAVRAKIWNKTGGILQADNEGFSNEDGYHILWQFSDSVSGEWNCAVKNVLGQWAKFTMDLGDIVQRQEFQNGKIPKKAIRIK